MHEHVTMLIFEGGNYTTSIGKMVAKVRKAVVLDLIELASEVREIDEILLVTNYEDLVLPAQKLGAIVEKNDDSVPFHFGTRLKDVINKYQMQNVIYFGGGAAPLINHEDLLRIAMALKEQKNTVITNNYDSADFVAFTPGKAINHIELHNMDNTLAKLFHNQAGLRLEVLEKSLSNSFDIDTLMDCLVLGVQPRTGIRTRHAIKSLNFDMTPLENAKEIMATPGASVCIYGRINPNPMDYLSNNARCHLRIFSEERNMRALGRIERQEVRSLLGYFIEKTSIKECCEFLANICDCAFIDTRVLFAHFNLDVSAPDRFYSDIGDYEQVNDPFVKKLTKGFAEADIPIICGGHTLVNGGTWALLDAVNLESLGTDNENKIHRIVVEMDAPICGLTIDTAINYLGFKLKVVALTEAANTQIDPPLSQEIHPGAVLYVMGSKKQIETFKEYANPSGSLD